MSNLNWKTVSSEILFQDRWLKIRSESCLTPAGKIIEPYYVIDYPNWANALALTQEGQVILVKIYRHGLGEAILELPGGNIDGTEESPETAIQREFLEETGYAFEQVERVHEISPNPANHSNKAYGFLLTGGKKIAAPQLEESESLEVVLMDLNDFKQLLFDNQLVQAMHVTTAFYALRKLEKNDER